MLILQKVKFLSNLNFYYKMIKFINCENGRKNAVEIIQ